MWVGLIMWVGFIMNRIIILSISLPMHTRVQLPYIQVVNVKYVCA